MKGVILAGGNGNRLGLLTKVTNKHLLPVYNEPMIFHPLRTLIQTGIKEILVVSGRNHAGHFLELLGSGKSFGVNLIYAVQEEAGGIAQALSLAKNFAANKPIAVILGDNIFEDDFSAQLQGFTSGALFFLKEMNNPSRFGVTRFEGHRLVSIEEKPHNPPSKYAVTGMYLYDASVFDIISTLKPSARGELEITDVNNHYINQQQANHVLIQGKWTDAGTFASLLQANILMSKKFQHDNL